MDTNNTLIFVIRMILQTCGYFHIKLCLILGSNWVTSLFETFGYLWVEPRFIILHYFYKQNNLINMTYFDLCSNFNFAKLNNFFFLFSNIVAVSICSSANKCTNTIYYINILLHHSMLRRVSTSVRHRQGASLILAKITCVTSDVIDY